MIGSAFFATTVISMALGLYLLQECQFLIPYRSLLIEKYASAIALFALTFFVNCFAAIYALARRIFLKDTGRKLAHMEKQLRRGPSISEELSEHLRDQ